MKIVLVSPFFGDMEGGAEVSTKLLADKLMQKKYDVNIISFKPRTGYNVQKLKFMNFLSTASKAFLFNTNLVDSIISRKFCSLFKRIKPDIVHVQDILFLPAAVKAAKKLGIKIMMTVRDDRFVCNLAVCKNKGNLLFNCSKKQYVKCLKITAKKKLRISTLAYFLYPFIKGRPPVLTKNLTKTDFIVAVSNYVKKNLLKAGIDGSKIKTIYNYAPVWEKSETIEKSKETIIFAPGRLEDYKGFDVIIKAFSYLSPEKNNIKLIIAGNGPERKGLEKLAAKLNLTNLVLFTGKISIEKIKKLYFSCYIVVLGSLIGDSLSRTILESFYVGKPLVATNTGGTSEMVKNNKTGLLVKAGSAEEMANALDKLVKDKNLRQKLAANSKALIKGHNEKEFSKLVNIYVKLNK